MCAIGSGQWCTDTDHTFANLSLLFLDQMQICSIVEVVKVFFVSWRFEASWWRWRQRSVIMIIVLLLDGFEITCLIFLNFHHLYLASVKWHQFVRISRFFIWQLGNNFDFVNSVFKGLWLATFQSVAALRFTAAAIVA